MAAELEPLMAEWLGAEKAEDTRGQAASLNTMEDLLETVKKLQKEGSLEPQIEDLIHRINELQQGPAKKRSSEELGEAQALQEAMHRELDSLNEERVHLEEVLRKKQATCVKDAPESCAFPSMSEVMCDVEEVYSPVLRIQTKEAGVASKFAAWMLNNWRRGWRIWQGNTRTSGSSMSCSSDWPRRSARWSTGKISFLQRGLCCEPGWRRWSSGCRRPERPGTAQGTVG
ncbi:mCG141541, isoform CRA_a [Mus musculus]|nr:mCG141541, isoform CRA_a [Mus musculus]